MPITFSRRAVLMGGAALAACATAPSEGSPFAGKLESWTRTVLQQSPEDATRGGYPETYAGVFKDRLDDRSASAVAHERALAPRLLGELNAIDRAGLSDGDKLTYDVLKAFWTNQVGRAQFDYGTFSIGGGARPYVLSQGAAFFGLPDFFDNAHAVNDLDDANAYVARLSQVARALDSEAARARADAARGAAAPDFITAKTLRAIEGAVAIPVDHQIYLTALRRKLDALVANGRPQARADAILARAERIVRTDILPAHQRTAEYLRAAQGAATHDAGVWKCPRGDEYYAAALRYATTTALSADEVHEIGLARVAEMQAAADAALRREGYTQGSIGDRLTAINNDPGRHYSNDDAGRAQIMADTRARIARVMAVAPQWFAHLPRAPLEVRRMPPVIEAVQSAAYYFAPALDGSQPGAFYMTLADMTKVSRVDLATVTHHEGVPGHHFQIALALERDDIPLLRRVTHFTAYVEGWALYAEQLVNEQGFYNADNESRVGYLRWALWRGCRLVVDTGLHAKRWTREQAIQYMQDNLGGADPTTIVNEVDRYVANPGQACAYEMGRREIVRLREEARAALGPRFDLRGFHDAVLLQGALSLDVLGQQVRAWSASVQDA